MGKPPKDHVFREHKGKGVVDYRDLTAEDIDRALFLEMLEGITRLLRSNEIGITEADDLIARFAIARGWETNDEE